jgi:hypothetical protein
MAPAAAAACMYRTAGSTRSKGVKLTSAQGPCVHHHIALRPCGVICGNTADSVIVVVFDVIMLLMSADAVALSSQCAHLSCLR